MFAERGRQRLGQLPLILYQQYPHRPSIVSLSPSVRHKGCGSIAELARQPVMLLQLLRSSTKNIRGSWRSR
jgi:hypothetical protein